MADIESASVRPIQATTSFVVVTYSLAAVGLVGGSFLLRQDPLWTLYVAAVLCGWSEVEGLCGTSHVCALTGLRAIDARGRLWLKAVTAYTAGGIVTAACVGASLALIGQTVGISSQHVFSAIAVLAVILAVRETNLIQFRLPQVHRQTQKMWAFQFGFVTAAAMWGAHIGLGFATVVAHGGFLALTALALAAGPKHGALLIATYWLGRALPMWMAPALTSRHGDAAALCEEVSLNNAAYRYIAFVGLVCIAGAALMLVQNG